MALQELRAEVAPASHGEPLQVVLRTHDLAVSAGWYARAVGLRVLSVGATRIGLGDPAGGEPLLCLVRSGEPAPPVPGTRLTFTVASALDWLVATERAARAGAPLLRVLDHGTERAFHLRDPDGLEVAIAVRGDAAAARRGAVARPSMALDPRGLGGQPGCGTGAEPVGLGGIHLQVSDLAVARARWTGEPGLFEVAGDERSAFFAPTPDGHPCVGVSLGAAADGAARGLAMLALRTADGGEALLRV